MFTADALVCHAVGDYILQSHWQATNKTSRHFPAAVHALTYAIPFLFITQSALALAVIVVTHFLIDRYRLARFVVRFKNTVFGFLGDTVPPTDYATATGYPESAPPWLAVWLLIIADNICHIGINALAIKYL